MIKLAINRPVTTIMLFIALSVIGYISFDKLPFEPEPNTEYPTLNISAYWANASPETMEKKVTAPLESAIEGLDYVYETESTSNNGYSRITIKYVRDTDMNMAYISLNEKVFSAKRDLPDDVRRSVSIGKYIPRDQQTNEELISFEVYGNRRLSELYQYAEDNIKPLLVSLDGVANVEVSGGSSREIKIKIDRDKTSTFNINPYQVSNQLSAWGIRDDVGIVKNGQDELSLIIDSRYNSFTDILNIPIKKLGVNTIYLKDIAEVEDGLSDNYGIRRINGVSTIIINIVKESGKNAIDTAKRVVDKIEELKEELPSDIKIEISTDSTEQMRKDLDDITLRAVISIIIITIVLLLFLRDVKTPIVILVTIALSIAVTMTYLFFSKNTINTITLSGLVLAFGLLVDNSIVVIENIYHKLHKGHKLKDASYDGAKEMILPVIAATLTTCIVFIPFLYLQGEKAIYWKPLALVVIVALISSLFISFTFIPTLSTLINRGKIKVRVDSESHGPLFLKNILIFLVKNKTMTLIFVLTLVAFSYYLFDKYVDKGAVWWGRGSNDTVSVYVSMPTGSTIEMSDSIITKFEKQINLLKGYKKFVTSVGATYASVRVIYDEDSMYSVHPFEMESELVSIARNFAGPFISIYNPVNPNGGYRAGGTTGKQLSYQFAITGYSYDELKNEAKILSDAMVQSGKVSEVDINSTGNFWRSTTLFSYIFDIDRESLGRLKTNVSDILRYVMINIGGGSTKKINFAGEESDVSIKYSDYKEFSADNLKDLNYDYTTRPFRIGNTGHIEKKEVMSEITKKDQSYKRILAFDYKGSSKAAEKYKSDILENYKLPTGFAFDTSQNYYMTDEEETEIMWVMGVAILLVFMITASLFESFWHPFLIILTVPLGMVGVFFIFFFMDASFNREAFMGTILLSGIAVNNSIILVNHINHLRSKGQNLMDAVVNGSLQRYRPILMTTATTVLGILPLFLYSNEDDNFWYSLSITTVGGLIASTIFVLTVIPVLYVLIESVKRRVYRFFDLFKEVKL
ncbi:MAG: efflux RND transporter permease subunit [Candidatus Delongbacteria bacterium]|nr:efflux RND transporter permease subunit [Candidatus Delongbacteria bacterium]MBN2834957.1 efflux RND transporter permease subunit [Candidatus Delongbacteria bacterium]